MNDGEEQNVTAALNWHLFSNLRMQFNYTYADLDDTGDVLSNASGQIHAFQTRARSNSALVTGRVLLLSGFI